MGATRVTVYSLSDARNQLPTLLRQVEEGQDVVIARHGVPIARLVPADLPAPYSAPRSLARLIAAMPQAPDDNEEDLFGRSTIAPRDIEF